MTEERETAGPWRYQTDAIVSDIPNGEWATTAVAYVGDAFRHVGGLPFGAERDANARLIAAAGTVAPSLRAAGYCPVRAIEGCFALTKALNRCLGIIVEFGDLNGFRNMTDEELGRAYKAVAVDAAELLNSMKLASFRPTAEPAHNSPEKGESR